MGKTKNGYLLDDSKQEQYGKIPEEKAEQIEKLIQAGKIKEAQKLLEKVTGEKYF